MPEVWRLLELTAPEDPVWNMALDTVLLNAPADSAPVLRFYRWSQPALSIGYFQNVEKIARSQDCAAKKIQVIRRPTGGGMVPHGTDLTLSFAVSENHPRLAGKVSESYREVHALIREALLPLFPGLTFSACAAPLKARSERPCFEEPVACDLEFNGHKIVGSSQRRKNGRLLHQTSIQLAGDMTDMAKKIVSAFESRWNIRAAAGRITASEAAAARDFSASLAASGEWAFVPSARPAEKHPIFS